MTTYLTRHSLVAAAAIALSVAGTTPLQAQTTPCEAIFEPVLAQAIAEANLRLRLSWRMLDDAWVTAYVIEPAKINPFDPDRLGERPPAARGKPPTPAAPVVGHASARDVRCNASASSAVEGTTIAYIASAVRFQEGSGPWSAILPNATIASFVLKRTAAGWTLVDRSAEHGVLPPDARLSAPSDTIAQSLAAKPWPQRTAKSRKR